MSYFFWVLLSLLLPSVLMAGSPIYGLCVDGGGSKTMLQVVNNEGTIMRLLRNGRIADCVTVGGSNINVIGKEGLRALLTDLFYDVRLHDVDGQPLLTDVMPNCQLYAGMSGLGLEANKAIARDIFASFGITPARMIVKADAEMALDLLENKGIILIAGTGSICFGKNYGDLLRVGGLGRVLGDEGSCYQVGYQALKAVLAHEYGWGKATALTSLFQGHFDKLELKKLIPGINAGTTPSSVLAALTPIVCSQAMAGDVVAKKIIQKTKRDLLKLVRRMIRLGKYTEAPLHCWGGLFKSTFAEEIIAEIVAMAAAAGCALTPENCAYDNVALRYALAHHID